MRRLLTLIAVGAAGLIISATTVLANEGSMSGWGQSEEKVGTGKDECLLVAMNCANSVDTLQQKIARLRGEIAKGTDVYTTDELNKLKKDLDEATQDLYLIEHD
jgi:hypothetical protein